jgi:hypothetical protein
LKKLPFYYYSCGIMGHTENNCPNPTPRSALGKLPYDIKLRAPGERKMRMFSFGHAEIGHDYMPRPATGRQGHEEGTNAAMASDGGEHHNKQVSPPKTSATKNNPTGDNQRKL